MIVDKVENYRGSGLLIVDKSVDTVDTEVFENE